MKDTAKVFITREAIENLTEKLKLPTLNENSQDWELEIANPSRVCEFVSYYDESADMTLQEKFALMSLIISSFDEALLKGEVQEGTWEKIKRLLICNIDLHRNTILYWSLVNEEMDGCFSVTPFMREIIKDEVT